MSWDVTAHLQVVWVVCVSKEVDGRQEDGFDLVVTQFVGWLVCGDEHLSSAQRNLRVLRFAQSCQVVEQSAHVVCQPWLVTTQVVLQD